MMGWEGAGGRGCPEEVPDSAWLGREDFLEEAASLSRLKG